MKKKKKKKELEKVTIIVFPDMTWVTLGPGHETVIDGGSDYFKDAENIFAADSNGYQESEITTFFAVGLGSDTECMRVVLSQAAELMKKG